MQYITKCKFCSKYVLFAGQGVPLDHKSKEPHRCDWSSSKSSKLTCRYCGMGIHFDNNIRSSTGKLVPLSNRSGAKHRCRVRQFNTRTRRAWWRNQQKKTEQEHERRRIAQEVIEVGIQLKACKILGINLFATEDEIKTAYRRLMMMYHPDRYDGEDAHDKTVEINWAYENCFKRF